MTVLLKSIACEFVLCLIVRFYLFCLAAVVLWICSVDERDGFVQSLQQSELLVHDKQATISQLNGQTAALQSEISAFKHNKDDVSLYLCMYVLVLAA